MRYYTTSDTHFGHSKIIEYANRPFKDCTQMNTAMIRNWNERVKEEDTVFFVGDFVFKSGIACQKADYWIKQLNGNIIFIRGNHDNNNSLKTAIDCIHVTYANKKINLVHKPEHANPNIGINLVGHVHQSWTIRTFKEHYDIIENLNNNYKISDRHDLKTFLETHRSNRNSKSILFNVGVDVHKYRPISLDEVLGYIQKYKRKEYEKFSPSIMP